MTTISDYYCEETTECLNMSTGESKLSVEGSASSTSQAQSQPQMDSLTASSSSASSSQAKPISPLHKNKSALGRVFHPPKLERKHSSGDLHSRLKTRKILGVGETDNGDIHRSKISQVLGHNEHLYYRPPNGYRSWQFFLALIMGSQAIFILIFPGFASDMGLAGVSSNTVPNTVASQYYAGTMLALAFLLWKFLNMNDKAVTRAVQIAALINFSVPFVVDVLYALKTQPSLLFETSVLAISSCRVGIALICYFYLSRIGAEKAGLRKSPSYKDLVESSTRKD